MNIAIITPIYKHTQHLRRLLDSCLWQMTPPDELILCCERDEEGALRIFLEDYYKLAPEDNVRLVVNDSGHANAAGARNAALKKMGGYADGWVKFLDADDVLAPFALETFRLTPAPPQVQCVAGTQLKVLSGRIVGMGMPDWKVIERRNPTLPSMTFVRRSAVEKVGCFNSEINFEEDYDFWLRLRANFGMGAFANVSWPVCYYWIDQAERAAKPAVSHQINGMDVREYFAREYAITPER